MKKFFAAVCLFAAVGAGSVFAQHGPAVNDEDSLEICDFENAVSTYQPPFQLSWALDVPLAVGGIGTYALYSLTSDYYHKKAEEKYEGVTLNPEDINPFDSLWYVTETGTGYGNFSNITMFSQFLLVPSVTYSAAAIFGKLNFKDCLTLGAMYTEAFLISFSVEEFLNNAVARPRPRLWTNTPITDSDSADFTSFPSGHTTLTSMSAAFMTYTFLQYYPDSPWFIPVTAVSWGLTGATMVFRICSGSHFMSDVLAGCALGSAIGFLVPWSHKLVTDIQRNKKSEGGVALKGISILPTGVAVSISF